MRRCSHRRCRPPLQRQILPRCDALHPVRRRSGVPLSLGRRFPSAADVRIHRDAFIPLAGVARFHLSVEKGRAGLEPLGFRRPRMTAAELAQMPDAAALLALDAAAVLDGKFDRGEWTLIIAPSRIRWAAEILKVRRGYRFLSD